MNLDFSWVFYNAKLPEMQHSKLCLIVEKQCHISNQKDR